MKYTKEFKLHAVKQFKKGITIPTPDGLKSLKVGRKKKMKKPSNDKKQSELEKLREENEYLKAENEYLKNKKEADDEKVFEQIKEIFDDNKSRYGYRRVHLKLKEKLTINHKRVQRVMRINGLTFHSDQGWRYQHPYYQRALKDKGILQSFSRKGNCIDNALMENFFGIMKNEMFYGQEYKYKTLEDLKLGMIDYINYYNNKRINLKRKGLTPLQFRNKSISLTN